MLRHLYCRCPFTEWYNRAYHICRWYCVSIHLIRISPSVGSLQHSLDIFHEWTSHWKIKVNGAKLTNVLFVLHHHSHQPVVLNQAALSCRKSTKYLGPHLGKHLTFQTHIKHKRGQLYLWMHNLFCLLWRRSSLSLANKCVLYVTTLNPVWLYTMSI